MITFGNILNMLVLISIIAFFGFLITDVWIDAAWLYNARVTSFLVFFYAIIVYWLVCYDNDNDEEDI